MGSIRSSPNAYYIAKITRYAFPHQAMCHFYRCHFCLCHFYRCHIHLCHFFRCRSFACHFCLCHFFPCHFYQCHFFPAIFTVPFFWLPFFLCLFYQIRHVYYGGTRGVSGLGVKNSQDLEYLHIIVYI